MIPKLNLICGKDELVNQWKLYVYWDGEVFCATDGHKMVIWRPEDNASLPSHPIWIHKDEWKKLTKKQKGSSPQLVIDDDGVKFGALSCEYMTQEKIDEKYGLVFKKTDTLVIRGIKKEGVNPYIYPNWRVVWPNVFGIDKPATEDFFRYSNTREEISQIGVNADYLSKIQEAMGGDHTKLTFYGKSHGILVECPDTPFSSTNIIGLLMPIRIR